MEARSADYRSKETMLFTQAKTTCTASYVVLSWDSCSILKMRAVTIYSTSFKLGTWLVSNLAPCLNKT